MGTCATVDRRQSGAPAGVLGGMRTVGPVRGRTVPNAAVDAALASPGRPLDPGVRSQMERGFGHDFSGVRVHTDETAAASASALQARAYTHGERIVFARSAYDPSTHEGRELLAHELAHVVQQRAGGGGHAVVSRQTNGRGRDGSGGGGYTNPVEHCHRTGVPCPSGIYMGSTLCRLIYCRRSITADLPFAVSPGICVYECRDGRICACVLVGSGRAAACVFRICTGGGPSSHHDVEGLADRALAMATRSGGQEGGRGEGSTTVQAKLEVSSPEDAHEREADRVARAVVGGTTGAGKQGCGCSGGGASCGCG